MALAHRKRVILIGLEGTYGTDSTPTAAVQCSNLEIAPLEGSEVERDFIKPYMGGSGSIRTENYVTLSFDTEIAGSGTAGTAPAWGNLLLACNFSETTTAAPITGTAQASGSTTTAIKLAAGASATDDFYTGMTVTLTAGTGDTQKGEIVSYVGSTKIATISHAWTTPPDGTTTYSIGANVMYTPNSDFGIATANTSLSIYFNVDGVRHILLGARGNPSFDLSAKAIAKIKWKFTGLLGVISDQALPSASFTTWKTPVTISTANTTDISLLGFTAAKVMKLDFDIANDVKYRQLIGGESVLITDRKPKGNASIEATTVAAKDWWTAAQASSTGVFCAKHGQTAGYIVGFTAPKVQIVTPKYSESDGVVMLDFGMDFIPYGSSGNDELRICVK